MVGCEPGCCVRRRGEREGFGGGERAGGMLTSPPGQGSEAGGELAGGTAAGGVPREAPGWGGTGGRGRSGDGERFGWQEGGPGVWTAEKRWTEVVVGWEEQRNVVVVGWGHE